MKQNLTIHLFICLFIFIFCGIKTGWGQDCVPTEMNNNSCKRTIMLESSIAILDSTETYAIGTPLDIIGSVQNFSIDAECPITLHYTISSTIDGMVSWQLVKQGSSLNHISDTCSLPTGSINTNAFPNSCFVEFFISDDPNEIPCYLNPSNIVESGIAQSRNASPPPGNKGNAKFKITCNPCPKIKKKKKIVNPNQPVNKHIQKELVFVNARKDFSKSFIYPNPTYGNSKLTFTLPEEDRVEISIADISGIQKRFVEQRFPKGKQTIDLNLTDMSFGFYTIILKTTHTIEILKIIKSK